MSRHFHPRPFHDRPRDPDKALNRLRASQGLPYASIFDTDTVPPLYLPLPDQSDQAGKAGDRG